MRPLSLLPKLAKLFNRIINSRLVDFLESNDGLSDTQFGFQKGRSKAEKRRKNHSLCVFLDISNAFNTVWPAKVVEVARSRGVPEYLIRVLASFLNEWRINTYDTQHEVKAGCPQGSSLGLTIWNLVMEDLFDRWVDTAGGGTGVRG